MEIDLKELEKQRAESIIQSGEYCKVDILVGGKGEEPVANVRIKNVSPIEVAVLITSLKATAKSLEKRHPLARKIARSMGAETYEIEG